MMLLANLQTQHKPAPFFTWKKAAIAAIGIGISITALGLPFVLGALGLGGLSIAIPAIPAVITKSLGPIMKLLSVAKSFLTPWPTSNSQSIGNTILNTIQNQAQESIQDQAQDKIIKKIRSELQSQKSPDDKKSSAKAHEPIKLSSHEKAPGQPIQGLYKASYPDLIGKLNASLKKTNHLG